MINKLAAALKYCELGFSVIPVGSDKKPHIQWTKYQKEKASDDQIKQWWSQFPHANIGIVTGTISGLAVIDIDTDEGRKSIQKYIPDSLLIPTANTPGGGLHLYFKCPDEKLTNNVRVIPGCDLRANGGYIVVPPSINGTGKGYAWQEGLSIFEVEPAAAPQAYLSFIKKASNYINNNSLYRGAVTPDTQMFVLGSRDNDLFRLANCLVKGKMTDEEIFQVLNFVGKNCNPPFPEKDIRTKILSAMKREEHREINFTHEVEQWVSVTEGNFSITDCYNELHSVTGVTNRNNYRVTLNRIKGKGVIEKAGNKDGIFRRVDDAAEEINFLDAQDTEIKLTLPFGIHTYVNIYPRNIMVVAGTPDAGKTAFLLNTVEMNMNKHEIYYFSSEMAEQELKLRLSKFDRPLKDFTVVKWLERSSDFHDVIKPNAVNIIDFLEVHEEFWKVGLFIKLIFDKLSKGIAIIAIQKDKDKEYGLGATRSLEKARLYINMNPGELVIKKAKNWATGVNPNGMKTKFKLIQGCKFQRLGDWAKE